MGLLSCSNSINQEEIKHKVDVDQISDNGFVSICVKDIEHGETLLALNEAKRLIPASLTKVFTTSAAIELLGQDFRFRTKIFLAQSNDHKFQLLVKGGGDPTLGSDRWDYTKEESLFREILKVLRERLITNIDGGIVIDESLFDGIAYPSKRNWEDMGNYYGAPPSAISFKENTFILTLSSPKQTEQLCTIVGSDPKLEQPLDCFVKSSPVNKDSAYIYGHPNMDRWYVSGTIPAGRKVFTIKGALPDPGMTLAKRLKLFLLDHNINVRDQITKNNVANYTNKEMLLQFQSPRLEEIVDVVNKKSFNLFADHLFFQLAIANNINADWDNASMILEKFWKERLDIFTGKFYDGSGLSPFNRFSSLDMVNALTYIHKTEYANTFKHTLSKAGENGTLKSFFNDKALNGSFIGKSGSMNSVLGYCGYVNTKSGQSLAVCIMVNGFNESHAHVRDNIAKLLADIIYKY